jgi:hypothetical protein
VLSGEAANTNRLVFGFTRSGLEPIIYRTRGEHANHYITFAVEIDMGIEIKNNICNKRKTIYTKEV